MDRIQELLDIYHAEYTKNNNTFYLSDYGDIWGQITVIGDIAYFSHGNKEESINIHSVMLGEWIDNYLLGFDDFERYVNYGN